MSDAVFRDSTTTTLTPLTSTPAGNSPTSTGVGKILDIEEGPFLPIDAKSAISLKDETGDKVATGEW
jgi:hypothetical protein